MKREGWPPLIVGHSHRERQALPGRAAEGTGPSQTTDFGPWLGMVLDALEQLACRHAEPVRDLRRDLDARIASQRLDPRDVAQRQAGFVGQAFLR